MLTVDKERYEVLATLGSGGEARIVKALDRRHDRFVALKIRRVRDEADRRAVSGEARVLLAVPPHPALPLVREDFGVEVVGTSQPPPEAGHNTSLAVR